MTGPLLHQQIDDCWATSRDSDGTIIADAKKFPEGIKAIADSLHKKGLKFGIYTDRGTKTCGGRPGSQGYEAKDSQTYAGWGVDYIKSVSGLAVLARSLLGDSTFTRVIPLREQASVNLHVLCTFTRIRAMSTAKTLRSRSTNSR
jgi:hypothetical protein